MIGGWRPLVPEILDQTDRVGAKSPIFDRFSLVEKKFSCVCCLQCEEEIQRENLQRSVMLCV